MRVGAVLRFGRADASRADASRASQGYSAITAYSQSKLANCMFTLALADRLKSQGQVRAASAKRLRFHA